jgi:2-polyprenyl-3-methyl-5-hydroxy-6-metoxy-1,4-benzoquinol methylase
VEDAEPIYERVHETGTVLGRLHEIDVLCRECGFMYTNPRPSISDMRRYYTDASDASGSVYHSMEPGSRLHRLTQERVSFMGSLIRKRFGAAPGSILDIGCSIGDLLLSLDLKGWTRTGLEPSKIASRLARDRGLDVNCGELETAEIPEGSYSVVSCMSVLEPIWDLEASMKKIAQCVD